MKLVLKFALLFAVQIGFAQVVLDADGPGNTYELITSVLAPGANPIEVPDCGHTSFGRHIHEVFDTQLNSNVFRFHIHVTPDNDRCQTFDRQRNEIKTYGSSPANLKGVEGEVVQYKWKFKLPFGFQSSPNFTHIHQLKSVGGSFASMPMYTLTTRKGSPDQLELRYAQTTNQITLKKTDIAPFLNTWVEVTETIRYDTQGTYEIEINRISDGAQLFQYSNQSIVNWRPGGSFVRPKWGIYRSLINSQDLRDEAVFFNNFSIEELPPYAPHITASSDCLEIFPNPYVDEVYIDGAFANWTTEIIDANGSVISNLTNSTTPIMIDLNSLGAGPLYIKMENALHGLCTEHLIKP